MHTAEKNSWLKHLDFTILDIICVEIAFFLAYYMRHHGMKADISQEYQILAYLAVVLDLCIASVISSYRGIIRRGRFAEASQVLKHNILLVTGMIIYMFFTKNSAVFSRLFFVYFFLLSICIMLPARLIWKRVLRIYRKSRREQRAVVILSEYARLEGIVHNFLKQHYRDYDVTGLVAMDRETEGESISGISVIGDAKSWRNILKEHIVDEVFISIPDSRGQEEMLMNYFLNAGITVHINLGYCGESLRNKTVDEFAGFTVLSGSAKIVAPWQILVKRLMDIVGSLAGLFLTGLAYLIFAPVIRRQSPGPVFFRQERVGRHGRHFYIYKFRTMCMDAEERKAELMKENKMKGFMFKMDDDPRVLPIGRFMRKYSIDELPQFWNVLKGDMSMVGTRPPTLSEVEEYEQHHRKRLAFKPGITGMWQVNGRSGVTDFEDVVAMDAKYISEWSIGLDIKILLKTVSVVLKGDGAV